jgi:hypothetical protein
MALGSQMVLPWCDQMTYSRIGSLVSNIDSLTAALLRISCYMYKCIRIDILYWPVTMGWIQGHVWNHKASALWSGMRWTWVMSCNWPGKIWFSACPNNLVMFLNCFVETPGSMCYWYSCLTNSSCVHMSFEEILPR